MQDRQLTEVMNSAHENVLYFPGVSLPHNLVARSDLEDVVRDADVLVFCAPHQFMRGLVSSLQGKVRSMSLCAASASRNIYERPRKSS